MRIRGRSFHRGCLLMAFMGLWAVFGFGCQPHTEVPDKDARTSGPAENGPPPISVPVEFSPEADSPAPPPSLDPVFRSMESAPDWVENGPIPTDELAVAVGKGSSVKNVYESQHKALVAATTKLLKEQFGDKTRVEVRVEWLTGADRITVSMEALVHLGADPVVVRDLIIDGSYYEVWETSGQKVWVFWARVYWPLEQYRKILRESSI